MVELFDAEVFPCEYWWLARLTCRNQLFSLAKVSDSIFTITQLFKQCVKQFLFHIFVGWDRLDYCSNLRGLQIVVDVLHLCESRFNQKNK